MGRQQQMQPPQEQMQPRGVAYPEHEKMRALGGAIQVVGDFLAWLGEHDFEIAARHEHSEECWGENFPECGYRTDALAPVHRTIVQWLSVYFEIDEGRLEEEKRRMLR
jgi:hypothetical protein